MTCNPRKTPRHGSQPRSRERDEGEEDERATNGTEETDEPATRASDNVGESQDHAAPAPDERIDE